MHEVMNNKYTLEIDTRTIHNFTLSTIISI